MLCSLIKIFERELFVDGLSLSSDHPAALRSSVTRCLSSAINQRASADFMAAKQSVHLLHHRVILHFFY